MSGRKYRYVTDEMWGEYLESQGAPLRDWFASDGSYGLQTADGQFMIKMDDDDERVAAIASYLLRLGQVTIA